MQPLLDDENLAKQPGQPIHLDRLESIISAGSTLRTSLSNDIGTKQLSRV